MYKHLLTGYNLKMYGTLNVRINCKFAVQIGIKYNPNIHFLFSN